MLKLMTTLIALTAIGVGVKAKKWKASIKIQPGITTIKNKRIIFHQ